jgi:hypothetical protein
LKRIAVLAAVLATGAAACGDLPDPSTIKDLRVLAVRCDPAGILVNLNDPGGATQADLTAQLTALVVDPLGGSQEVTFSAVGCPDYIDTITSATLQGSKLCPSASVTSQIPEPIGSKLATTTIIPADMPQSAAPVEAGGVEYNPKLSFGLRPDQIGAFFTPGQTTVPAIEQSIAYNIAFGLPAIVNLTFDLNGEHAEAIKRVVYWPDIGQPVNKNPTLDGINLYRHRDDATGNPIDLIDPAMDPEPTFSISAGDKLYVDPDYLQSGAVESYILQVRNPDTGQVEQKMVPRELVRFQFFATAGTFSPVEQASELDPALSGGTLHTDAEYSLPAVEEVPAGGLKVMLWIVTHDERAGTDWSKRVINVVP